MIVDRRQETPTSIQAIGIGFLLISVATPIGKHDRRRRLDVYREECQMSTNRSNRRGFLVVPIACALLAGCGVSQEKYDALAAQNAAQAGEISSLKQQVASRETHVARLQDAVKYTVNSELLFKSGSWTITPDGQEIMAKIASQLAPHQEQKLVINGYTDNQPVGRSLRRGGVDSNDALSLRRAEAVRQFLVSQGVKPGMTTVYGLGEKQPIASNDTKEGRAQNRRVEIAVAPPGS
jgi:chemotaxis protein MotB